MTEQKAVMVRPKFETAALAAREAFMSCSEEKVWKREIMFALQILRGSEMLQKCDPDSIKNAVLNLSLTGASLNPVIGQAYLVPRGGKCCLDFSYRGLAGIAMDSGSVKHIAPRLVYTFDTFEYEEINGDPLIKHRPELNPPNDFTASPDKFWDFLVCGYVVATMPDGSKIVTQPLPKWKLQKAMNTSKTVKPGTPWRTHPDEMSLKTLVKHAYKLLPQTDRMSHAVAVLNEHEGIDKTPPTTLMDRFGSTPEPREVKEIEPCEFCHRTEGHDDACPNNEPE
jgi:recombination protein RecT